MINILIIGETCIDIFKYCKVSKICPEAPVPVVTPLYEVSNLGMAGNTFANIKALMPGEIIATFNNENEITKTRYVEEKSNHMFLRVDEGEDEIKPFKWSLNKDAMLGMADITIVSDYNKGFLTDNDIMEIGKKSNLSIIDSKRKLTNELVKDYNFVKLNESERANNPSLNLDNVITTLGEHGAEYQLTSYPSPDPQQTIDVSGAGDTFTSSFITKYYQTRDIKTSIEFANKMAAQVVSKKGVVTPEI